MPVSRDLIEKGISKALELRGERDFKQSVEAILVLKDIDMKSQAGKIRETIALPKGRGKRLNVCVVADGELAVKAREAGAHLVLTSNELQGINRKQAKKIAEECDWVLVRPDLMGLVGRTLGPSLGPRGRVPTPLPPSADVAAMIKRYSSTIMVRTKEQPQLQFPIGTEDMSPSDLADNFLAVFSVIEGKLPNGAGNVAKIIFKTTMGAPVEVIL